MILVIMGMEVHPFDRLARAVDELAARDALSEEFFVQLGSCRYEPKTARFERYLSFGALCEKIVESSVVITHAGAGATLTCIQQGKSPIMVPRRAQHGEHVDDHQLPFTEKMQNIGLASVVHEMSELEPAIVAARGRTVKQATLGSSTELVDWLEGFWSQLQGTVGSRT
jgi:UDP-N-acetylglucosamine transferase subunit ALG13